MKRISLLLNKNRLAEGERSYCSISLWFVKVRSLSVLPSLFSGIDKRMETWGKEGKMDPFKTIYDVCCPCTTFLKESHIFHIACLSNDCTDD